MYNGTRDRIFEKTKRKGNAFSRAFSKPGWVAKEVVVVWTLYEELIAGIPSNLVVSSYNIARRWTTVVAGGNVGIAHTMYGRGPDRLLNGPLTGMELKAVAALAKSWDFPEASLGVAAINAYYNAWERVRGLPGFEEADEWRDDIESRTEKNAFYAFRDEIAGKRVAVIGHFPHIEREIAPLCELSILERSPSRGDYPDSACEYILPDQDYVFITGTALINKTLPRLLQICRGARVSLVGPTVPLTPVLFGYGVANLSGFVCTEPDRLDEAVRRGCSMEIFAGGRMVSIDDPDSGRRSG